MSTATQTVRNAKPLSVSDIPKLDEKQAGHIRRILNLAGQLADDWSGMMGRTTLQEDFGAYRFQLAYMSYALALAHVHRLPAAPGVFKVPFQRLITKILSPDAWTYWHYVSTGGGPFNKSLGEMPAEWNPVKKDNIMYSAYLQSMALLYHYLFNDDKYAAPGALTMRLTTLFWGNGGKQYVYDENSLNEQVYWNMIEKGYLGVACEPNCIFQICNQVPILGFRFHDMVYGGSIAKEVTDGYLKAWSEFGLLNADGHYHMLIQDRERNLITPPGIAWSDFWCAALMNAWNSDFVREHYPRHVKQWIKPGPNDTLWVPPAIPVVEQLKVFTSCNNFGWAAVCASEMGDAETLSKLLKYADLYLHPAWEKGGFHYRRHDEWSDAEGNFSIMDPCSGNALLSYARLNVDGGMKKLYEKPWDHTHYAEPALTDITGETEVTRAWYEASAGSLVLTLRPRDKAPAPVTMRLGNVWDRGPWTLSADGTDVASGTSVGVTSSGRVAARRDNADLVLDVTLGDGETDFILSWP